MLVTFRATTYQGAGKNRIFLDDIKVEKSKKNNVGPHQTLRERIDQTIPPLSFSHYLYLKVVNVNLFFILLRRFLKICTQYYKMCN